MRGIPRIKGSLSNWIANAAPGDRAIAQTYIHGGNDEVRQAIAAGHITANQKRSEDGRQFHLIVTRLGPTSPKRREKAPVSASGVDWISTASRDKSLLPARVKQATALHKAGKHRLDIAKEMGLASKTIGKYLQMAREAGELE